MEAAAYEAVMEVAVEVAIATMTVGRRQRRKDHLLARVPMV